MTSVLARGRPAAAVVSVWLLLAASLSACGGGGASAVAAPDGNPSTPGTGCVANPFGDRALYLRGGFNSWSLLEDHKFAFSCNRFELVTELTGAHEFKIGDEAWSADADFGGATPTAGVPVPLALHGGNMNYTFAGQQRFVLDVSASATTPTLTVTNCPAPPLGATTLYLRGGMNSWTATAEYAMTYRCDAYYLNVAVSGSQDFKVADANWSAASTYGAPAGAASNAPVADTPYTLAVDQDTGGAGNLSFAFTGEHTVKLAFDSAGVAHLQIGPRSFVDSGTAPVTDPVALSVAFDSRSTADKSPFGAAPSGTAFDYGFTAQPGIDSATLVIEKRAMEGNYDKLSYGDTVRVPMAKQAAGALERWTASHTYADIGVYGYYFEVSIGGKLYLYANNANAVYWTAEKGSNGVGQVVNLPSDAKAIRRYRQTIYQPGFTVPDWAQDAVYYYVFPERFRNGNAANDPAPAVDKYLDTPVEAHASWLDKPWLPGSGDGSDATYNNDFFGGDLAGITDKLDYIAELGANTLYITPVFQAGSNHKYDTADYKNVDTHFGSNADFVTLTAEAARRGIRVILDASLNHTGSDSIYFDKFNRYAGVGAFEGGSITAASPYADWYTFDAANTAKPYDGWGGSLDMPNVNKSSPSFRTYAYGAADSVSKLWMDRGIAGWRMDVAPWVPDDFWREWRTAVKGKDANALTVAETWFDASKFFLGDEFDTTMNYIFRDAVLAYANGGDAKAAYENIELMRENYPPQVFHALMNLVSSHDVARALNQLGYTGADQDAATIATAKQKFRLATFMQMTYPGSPAIYYGDEVGVTGGADPANRATYPWEDVGGSPDKALLADVKALTALRKATPALRRGTLGAPLLLDAQVIVQQRSFDGAVALVATNNGDAPKQVSVTLPAGHTTGEWRNALGGTAVAATNGSLTFTIPARYGIVLTNP